MRDRRRCHTLSDRDPRAGDAEEMVMRRGHSTTPNQAAIAALFRRMNRYQSKNRLVFAFDIH
jgi:hypothetical protein